MKLFNIISSISNNNSSGSIQSTTTTTTVAITTTSTTQATTTTSTSSTTTTTAPPISGAIVFLNVGQSNMVGHGTIKSDATMDTYPGVYEYNPITNSMYLLQQPTGTGAMGGTDGYSMSATMGRRIKTLTGHDVIFITAAHGNTYLMEWTNPNWVRTDTISPISGQQTTLYNRANDAFSMCIDYCQAHSIPVSYKFINWLQGENDATQDDTYISTYKAVSSQLFADWVALGFNKVFSTRISWDDSISHTMTNRIQLIQKHQNIDDPNMILTSYITSTFTKDNGDMTISDGTHYTSSGQDKLGIEVADTVKYWLDNAAKKPLGIDPVVELQGQYDWI